MASDALKKVQDKLFRGVQSSSEENNQDKDSGLSINIPFPAESSPNPNIAPPKANRSFENVAENIDGLPHTTFRERLASKLGPEYNGAERYRLAQDNAKEKHWKRWGPYLSDRQWVNHSFFRSFDIVLDLSLQATVREDYSADGDAWSHFPHEAARSRAYRWGEDGIAGISDNHQRLCFGLSLWNEQDPILKERLFGVTGHQGNHGEDVKELYYYLDSTPTHSYMKFLYKYPQRRFPYEQLVSENQARGRDVPEYELLDTDAFADDRYWDVFVEVRSHVRRMSSFERFFSTPRMKKIRTALTSASRATIAGQSPPLSMLFHSSGFRTRGVGRWKSPRCHPCPPPHGTE